MSASGNSSKKAYVIGYWPLRIDHCLALKQLLIVASFNADQ
jgi:hypothetical protein